MSLTMTMEHEQHQEHGFGYHNGSSQWLGGNSGYSSQHQSPIHEHDEFAFNPMPMEPMFSSSMPPPRSTYQSLQPLITPQWPSELTSQSYNTPIFSSTPIPSAPISTPVSAPPTTGRTSSTPRKTLTDADRRRMCLYAEEHPNVKQTEIGAMFGVERSTVSKVLRNKEKYLYQDEGNRSPVRKPKGKFPDIERALANWAKNHQKQGLPMSDALIKEKLHHFSLTVGNSEAHLKAANSTSWLEKFKQKNNLMGAKSRKNSLAEESEASNPASGAQTPNISPTSPPPTKEASPLVMDKEVLKRESPDLSQQSDFFSSHKPYHSLSQNSLASAFNEGASSTFSPGPQSPTSPFFTSPDTASPYMAQGSQMPSHGPSASAPNSAYPSQRPRSQTFPMLGIEPGTYVSPPSSEPLTPKFTGQSLLDNDLSGTVLSSVEEMHEHGLPHPISMHPPPPPIIPSPQPMGHNHHPSPQPMGHNHHPSPQPMGHNHHSSPITPSSAISSQLGGSPSLDETKRALEVVMHFFQNQPSGFVEPQEYVMMGKLMEKLQLRHHPHLPVTAGGEMPGGMHRIPSGDFIASFMGKD